MRLPMFYHAAGITIVVLYLIYSLSAVFLTLLEPTDPYSLSREELEDADLKGPQLIPKVIHQVYLGWDDLSMPEHWKAPQQSCLDLHPDYEYKLWDNETAVELLESFYPSFLSTWHNYKYPIQRADSIRYFILAQYGGVYIDLDNGCQRRLDHLLTIPAFMPGTTNHLGLTNHVMGSIPGHPYFVMLTASLQSYNRNWAMPYLTIMNSAGPHFVSMVWESYLRRQRQYLPPDGKDGNNPVLPSVAMDGNDDNDLFHHSSSTPSSALRSSPQLPFVRVLEQTEYTGNPWSFFTKTAGGSWHHWSWDTGLFRWVGQHAPVVAALGVCALVGVVVTVWVGVMRVLGYGVGVWWWRGEVSRWKRDGRGKEKFGGHD